ncbi:MAG: hypothetical protein V1929_05170 [bacterium]
MTGKTRLCILLLGLASVLFFWCHLTVILNAGDRTGVRLWESGDTVQYVRTAGVLTGGGRMNPTYRERILLPVLIAISDRIFQSPIPILWLVGLLQLPATIAAAFITFHLSGRQRVSLAAAGMYVLYPNIYRRGVFLDTDVLHAQLFLFAVALLFAFSRRSTWGRALAASVSWPLVQMARPTLFGVCPFLAVSLWTQFRDPRSRFKAVAICCSALVVPVISATINLAQFGIFAPSLHAAEMLHVWAVPRIKVVQRNAETPGRVSDYFNEEITAARADPRWRQLHGEYESTKQFAAAYRSVISEDSSFVRRNWRDFLASAWPILVLEVEAVPYLHDEYQARIAPGPYPDGSRVLRAVYKLMLIIAFCAVVSVWKTPSWRLGILVLGAFGLIFLPASFSWWWLGGRYRIPLDVTMIPLLCIALFERGTWLTLGGVVLLAYAPFRILGLPDTFMHVMTVAILVAYVALEWLVPERIRERLLARRELARTCS